MAAHIFLTAHITVVVLISGYIGAGLTIFYFLTAVITDMILVGVGVGVGTHVGLAAGVVAGVILVGVGVGGFVNGQFLGGLLLCEVGPLGVCCEGGGVDDAAGLCAGGRGGRSFYRFFGVQGGFVRFIIYADTLGGDFGVVICPGVALFGNYILVTQSGDGFGLGVAVGFCCTSLNGTGKGLHTFGGAGCRGCFFAFVVGMTRGFSHPGVCFDLGFGGAVFCVAGFGAVVAATAACAGTLPVGGVAIGGAGCFHFGIRSHFVAQRCDCNASANRTVHTGGAGCCCVSRSCMGCADPSSIGIGIGIGIRLAIDGGKLCCIAVGQYSRSNTDFVVGRNLIASLGGLIGYRSSTLDNFDLSAFFADNLSTGIGGVQIALLTVHRTLNLNDRIA